MKPSLRSYLIPSVAAVLLALRGISQAIIGVPLTGYTTDFTTAPPAGDWITSNSNIAGTDLTFNTAADIDTFVTTNNYNVVGLGTGLGTSSTDPPSVNELARYNTTRLSLQMRPRAIDPVKAANILIARIRNDTGAFIPSINVGYTFDNPGVGIEEVPGWNAYFSITGNSNWIKIPAFSTATPGALTANLTFGGTGWSPGALAYILWVDDNAVALDANEASYTMDNFSITVPVTPVITATLASITRGPGVDPVSPADDTVSLAVTIQQINLPPGSPGWTTTGAFPNPPVTGTYGSNLNLSDVPLASLPLTIGFADQANPAIITSIIIDSSSLPRYAALNLIGGTPSFVLLDASSAPQWAANGGSMSVVLNNGGATAVAASTAPISFAAGSQKCVTLVVEAQDSSTGTNFETPDTLKVELVTDVGTQVLTAVQDKDHSGVINGYSGTVAEPYDTFPLRDEFNRDGALIAGTFTTTFRLHGVVPAAATTAQIVITGANDAGTETYRMHDVVFTTCVDTDNDGKFDSEELVEGTDPNDPASRFRLVSQEVTGGNHALTVTTVASRNYQLDTSSDLLIWTPQAAGTAGTGSNLTLTTPVDGTRKFARVTVQ